jgi:hypothetical protein
MSGAEHLTYDPLIQSIRTSAGTPRLSPSSSGLRLLEERVDRLTLVCAAMWELIRQRTKLTEADLTEQMAIIDARDGSADSKITPKRTCGKCQRPLMGRNRKCLYCGYESPMQSAFDFV